VSYPCQQRLERSEEWEGPVHLAPVSEVAVNRLDYPAVWLVAASHHLPIAPVF
jgi:hypothetical protein